MIFKKVIENSMKKKTKTNNKLKSLISLIYLIYDGFVINCFALKFNFLNQHFLNLLFQTNSFDIVWGHHPKLF